MSDMNIPGIGAGKYDNLIETLMKKERAPRDSAAEDLKKYEQQNAIWRKINQFSTEIREKTRELYSFNNPFIEKTVTSSNERAITATASRDAREQTFKISINQIAQADSFLSQEVSKDFQVPKGVYTFTVGEKKFSLNWQGGKYRSFIDAVNKKGKDIIRISEIKTSPSAISLLFESQLTGEANKLEFSDDALSFALETGLIKKNDRPAVDAEKTEAVIPTQTTERIAFSNPVRSSQHYVLEYTVSLQSDAEAAAPLSASGATPLSSEEAIYGQVGSVSYKGVTVTNAPSDSGIASETLGLNTKPTAPVEDYGVLSLVSPRGTLIPLPALADTTELQTFSIPLSEYGDITGIAVHNNNTDKTVSIAQIKVYDPKATGEYIPVNPVSQAQEAVLTFEGIPVKRSTNNIKA